jgi:hypothetical protein
LNQYIVYIQSEYNVNMCNLTCVMEFYSECFKDRGNQIPIIEKFQLLKGFSEVLNSVGITDPS